MAPHRIAAPALEGRRFSRNWIEQLSHANLSRNALKIIDHANGNRTCSSLEC